MSWQFLIIFSVFSYAIHRIGPYARETVFARSADPTREGLAVPVIENPHWLYCAKLMVRVALTG